MSFVCLLPVGGMLFEVRGLLLILFLTEDNKSQEKRTAREPTAAPTSAGQPRLMRMRVAVCLHMQTNGLLYLIPTFTQPINP